jgi:hypothetical protein
LKGYKLFILFTFGLSLSACMKDSVQKLKTLNGVSWNGTYALPIINARFLPEEALSYSDEISNVGVYQDSQVYIEYRKTVVSIKGQDLFKLPSLNANFKYTLDAAEQNLLDGGSVVMERDQIIDWTHSNAAVDSILFKSGAIHVQVENNIRHSVSLTMFLLGSKPNNAGIEYIQIPWNGQTGQGSFDIDLSGVLADMSRGPKGVNQLRIRIRATFYNTSGGRINSTDAISCSFSNSDCIWSRVHGRFNEKEILTKTDDLRLGALSADFTANNTKFKDARIKVKSENTFGIPIEINLNSLGFINGDGSRTLVNGMPKSLLVQEAKYHPEKPTPAVDSVYLTAGNSNVAILVEMQPHYLFWNESVSTRSNSVKQTLWQESICRLSTSLELPLYLETKGLKLTASADLPKDWNEQVNNLEWVVFRLDILNELPLSLNFQAYFLDEQNNILDSLVHPSTELIPSAISDTLGNAIGTKSFQKDIKLEISKLRGIVNAQRLFMEARIGTSLYQGKLIEKCKIKQGQGLDCKLGIHSSLNLYRKF